MFRLKFVKGKRALQHAQLNFKDKKIKPPKVEAYCDANYAANGHPRPAAGWIIMGSGAPVMWASKTIKTMATSTTNAEVHALPQCSKDVIWLRRFIGELNIQLPTTMILEDNCAAESFANSLDIKARNKHIEVKNQYVRQLRHRDEIIVVHVETENQFAGTTTKNLAPSPFKPLAKRILGLCENAMAAVVKIFENFSW